MDSSRKQIRVRLEEDRNGLINYTRMLEKNIAELKQRLILAQGALQYLTHLLGDKNGNN